MNARQEIPAIDEELEEARRDLRDTLIHVNDKLDKAQRRLDPEQIIKRRPFVATCLAASLGFLFGGGAKGSSAVGLVVGALLIGAALRSATDHAGEV